MPAPPYARNMYQEATYWPPLGNDGFGGRGYGPAVPILCRWQDVAVMFRDTQGRELVSEAIVYTEIPVEVAGKLLLGVSVGSTPDPDALEVRQVGKSPDLNNTEELNKAYL